MEHVAPRRLTITYRTTKKMQRIVNNTLNVITGLPVNTKLFSVFVAFITPLSDVIHVVLALLIADIVTSVYYQMKVAAEKAEHGKRFRASLMIIESGKLRRTLEKMFFYVFMLTLFYAFDRYVLKIKPIDESSIYTFSITNLAAVLISLVELTSISANVSKITGNQVFDKIVKVFSKKVDKKFDIEE